MNQPIAKWWLYLYNLMDDYLVNEDISQAELIGTLQKFVTQSNLAEFENRLNLLFVFHCHAAHLQKSKAKGILFGVRF